MSRKEIPMVKRVFSSLYVAVFFFLGFEASAFAATTALPEDGSWLDLAKPILDAIKNGNGWIAAASFLVLASAFTLKVLAPRYAFFRTAIGALVIVFTGAYGAAVLTALAAAGTTALTGALALVALKIAIVAAGGYSVLRPLLVDVVEPFLLKRFPFLAPVLDLITYLFDKPPAAIVAKAEKAGADAAALKPSAGAAGVVGTSTEIE